ncbi:MAG: hypothetical protein ACOYZ6_16050 [Chloroflexota bacterium]
MNQEQKDSVTAIISVLTLIAAVIWFLTEPKFETLFLVLSTIATVLTMYASKKRIAKAEQRYITKPKKFFEVSVALWGPRGSGKSWLISALSRILNLKYDKEIDGLNYHLEKVIGYGYQQGNSFVREPAATVDTDSTIINFERSRTSEKFGQSISSFKHKIQIFDHPGDETTGAILIESNTRENQEKVARIALNLAESDIVIIALDHSQFNYWRQEHYDNRDEWIEREKNEYVGYLSRLFSVLESIRPDKKRFYAVCLMKADRIDDVQYNHPDGLIELLFGKKMLEAIKSINPNQIKTFAVSSFGYLPNSTRPNYDYNTTTIQEPESWMPFGVEYPFFWAFEQLEKQSLLGKFNKSLWGKLTAKSKIRKYISYPKPNYDM